MAWFEAMRRPLIALLALSVFPASAAAVTSPDRIGPADGNFDVRTVRAVPPDHAAAVAGAPSTARRRRRSSPSTRGTAPSARWAA